MSSHFIRTCFPRDLVQSPGLAKRTGDFVHFQYLWFRERTLWSAHQRRFNCQSPDLRLLSSIVRRVAVSETLYVLFSSPGPLPTAPLPAWRRGLPRCGLSDPTTTATSCVQCTRGGVCWRHSINSVLVHTEVPSYGSCTIPVRISSTSAP